ncbi:MAG: HlyD family secretion protein [Blastomonas fulva]|jgi:RND family efflux transporter MFP subunit|uniref:RND transporter n=1 Tax=Blastomonas fulva TaxID=1550728 RepID=A0ABM6M9S3_9SPHN|nr:MULTISPECIES: HlyD family efflux transporter periplasmic adaptor subunit [Blastomonas]AOG01901.1 hlyD secretion family protein [Blastomonas sp. RAC04]ASR52768.1 RND transporter [Blastomonas fulva]KPF72119.1 RND transporter [Blastomonas sp. AAP25]MCO5793334.1 HlyD family efflux transporter periplasmic adaptor subunit [Blastomonas sp.]MDK2758057.1 HlyD family efflux transporter periplasmic adaptor subunit [Blastomonas fulva]
MATRDHALSRFRTLANMRTPRPLRAFGLMVVFGLIAATFFMIYVPWVQTAYGAGQVIALNPQDRLQNVTALVPGRIEKWYVQDGQVVKEGDPIALIADNDPMLLQRLRAERSLAEAKVAAAASALSTARLDVGRTGTLFREGLASQRESELARIKVAEMEAVLAEARAAITQIDINLARQSLQTVRAPRDGVIQRISGGDKATMVSQGDVLASFAPTQTRRVVEIYVDGRDVPLIRRGQPVRLEFEGWPAIQFSGWPSVARGLFDGEVQQVDLAASTNGLFRVLVQEAKGKTRWPGEPYVRLGANARGWVAMEEVSVGFELWRQLNDFPLQNPALIEENQNGGTARKEKR